MKDLAGLKERLELTTAQRISWSCGVVHGQVPWFGDPASRFMCSQFVPDDGKPQHITLGLFLGAHRWAQGEFTPREALICASLILSKPAVAAYLSALTAKDAGGEG